MAHQLFSQTDDWELEDEGSDVRGWQVVDETGSSVGTVSDMIVDTETETIDRLVLDDGREIDIRTVTLSDGSIRLGSTDYATSTSDVEVDTPATGYETGTNVAATSGSTAGSEPFRVRRYAEELQAEKRAERVGEVRIDKDVVEEERTLDVPVTREEVDIRRVAVDRPASDAEIVDTGDTIRVPVTAETVQVTKEPRVVEELEVAKTSRTETERVSDTVRREEIDIDQEGDVRVDDDTSRRGGSDRI